jgi:hypothetical protein
MTERELIKKLELVPKRARFAVMSLAWFHRGQYKGSPMPAVERAVRRGNPSNKVPTPEQVRQGLRLMGWSEHKIETILAIGERVEANTLYGGRHHGTGAKLPRASNDEYRMPRMMFGSGRYATLYKMQD